MSGTKGFLRRHRSGRYIVRVHDDYAVLSNDGEWVLSKHPSVDEATAWCDTRWPDPETIIAPANHPPEDATRRLMATAAEATYRSLRIRGAVGEFRVAQFDGREHIVLPVVACMEAVIRPMNSDGPEYVPAEVLAIAPRGWNGRPCVGPHPTNGDGTAGSANDPVLLERRAFGQIFNAYYDADTTQLRVESWLDPHRAARVGDDALSVIERARNGEPIEVSIGAFVVAERQDGEHNGVPYEYVWRLAIPDHLALLPPEQTGACSYDMGCGVRAAARPSILTSAGLIVDDQHEDLSEEAPVTRAERIAALRAKVTTITVAQITALESMSDADFGQVELKASMAFDASAAADSSEKTGWRAKLGSLLQFTSLQKPGDMSDEDVRSILSEALSREYRGFRGVQAVYHAKNQVVYYVDPDPGGPTPLALYQRKYELAANGAVTFTGEPEQCRTVVSFEKIAAATEDVTAAGGCGCGGKKTEAAATKVAERTEDTMHRASRIQALIENAQSPFETGDQAHLESKTDEQLAAIEAKMPKAEDPTAAATAAAALAAANQKVEDKVTEKVVEKVAEKADPKTLSTEDFMKLAPEAVKNQWARYQAAEAAQRTELLTALEAQEIFSKTELEAKSNDELVKIAALAGLASSDDDGDYSGLGAHRAAADAGNDPPDPWAAGLAARSAAMAAKGA